MAEAKQAEDFEVFASLRHDGIVGGDDEQGEIDAGRPGEHVLDEALVAGHVHDAEAERRQIEVGEADVDGDAAGLFFGEAVAVDAGQRLDERGLAVVDVAGGAEDQVACHERFLGAGRKLIITTNPRRAGGVSRLIERNALEQATNQGADAA